MKVIIDPPRIDQLLSRGVEQVIEQERVLKKLRSGKKLRIKFGIDPTSSDLHLGHAVVLRKLRQFQDLGHTVVLIIGDFTAMIGDPSGRSEARKPLTKKEVEENKKDYLKQARKIINTKKAEVVYNSTWFRKGDMKTILELAGAGSIQQVLRRADFKKRLDNGQDVTLLEILYPLFQGYDSVMVKADIEIGGSDQLFNVLMGRRVQRYYHLPEQDVLTTQLLEGIDGVHKMSKTLNNYIALTDKPHDMFGKVMSIPDSMILKYFRLCTDLPDDELDDTAQQLKHSNPRNAKVRLAREIIALYYDKKTADKAEAEFDRVFRQKELPTDIRKISITQPQMPLLDLLLAAKLASSKSQARRLIDQKAVKINGTVVSRWDQSIRLSKGMTVQAGKRKFVKIN